MPAIIIEIAILFAVIIITYYAVPFKYQGTALIAACIACCVFMQPIIIPFAFVSQIIGWRLGLVADKAEEIKKKTIVIEAAIANLVLVGLANILITRFPILANSPFYDGFEGIVWLKVMPRYMVPLGMLSIAFQSISYVQSVACQEIRAEESLPKLSLYMLYFPTYIQNAAHDYKILNAELHEKHPFSYDDFCMGAQLMLWGLFKIILLGLRAETYVNTILEQTAETGSNPGVLYGLIAFIMFAIQLYVVVSGMNDMGMGLSQMFGIHLKENCRRPYMARSLREAAGRYNCTIWEDIEALMGWKPYKLRNGKYSLKDFISTILVLFIFIIIAFVIRVGGIDIAFNLLDSGAKDAVYSVSEIARWMGTFGLVTADYIIMAVVGLIMLSVDICNEREISIRAKLADSNIVVRWLILLLGIAAIVVFGVYGVQCD